MPVKGNGAGWPPAIKWPGSKRSAAAALAGLLPPARRYFDPFVGSGALLPYLRAGQGVAGDLVPELIALWRAIQADPEAVADGYAARWERLQAEGAPAFYAVRERFNAARDPVDLLFLTRTCVNGLARFNAAGCFNNSLHHTRPGIAPDRLRPLLRCWSAAVREVDFRAADYRETLAVVRRGDSVFLDPPYAGTRGRYHPTAFDLPAFFAELERLTRLGARWLLTFDGRAGPREYPVGLPEALYTRRLPLPTGHSPFPRLMRRGVDVVVETVYANF